VQKNSQGVGLSFAPLFIFLGFSLLSLIWASANIRAPTPETHAAPLKVNSEPMLSVTADPGVNFNSVTIGQVNTKSFGLDIATDSPAGYYANVYAIDIDADITSLGTVEGLSQPGMQDSACLKHTSVSNDFCAGIPANKQLSPAQSTALGNNEWGLRLSGTSSWQTPKSPYPQQLSGYSSDDELWQLLGDYTVIIADNGICDLANTLYGGVLCNNDNVMEYYYALLQFLVGSVPFPPEGIDNYVVQHVIPLTATEKLDNLEGYLGSSRAAFYAEFISAAFGYDPINLGISSSTATTGDEYEIEVGVKPTLDLATGTYQAGLLIDTYANAPPSPAVSSISPNNSPLTGGTPVTINGTNLDTAYQVYVDLDRDYIQDAGEACTTASIMSATSITCNLPAAATVGSYPLEVKTWGGTARVTSGITYYNPATVSGVSPDNGLSTGGTIITITGTNFYHAGASVVTGVKVGGTNCTSYSVTSNTNITCVTPSHSVGAVAITVQTSFQTVSSGNIYTYTAPSGWVKADAANTDATTSGYQIDRDANLIPVIRASDYTANAAPSNRKWADYANKRWANAVAIRPDKLDVYKSAAVGTEISEDHILSYWVYIPRYEYQVCRPSAATWNSALTGANCYDGLGNLVTDLSNPYNFNIKFQKNTQTTAYNGTPVGDWATHPAFWWDKDSDGTRETGEELNGIWVGKFEASSPTNSRATTAANVYVKPNQLGLAGNTVSQQFQMSLDLGKSGTNAHNLDTAGSHMLKNSEWGAVAYLATSIYGRGTSELAINTCDDDRYNESHLNDNDTVNDHTGWGGSSSDCSIFDQASLTSADAYNGANGVHASTTDNAYGIYDMSGGNNEYVMAYLSGTTDSSGFSSMPDSKYYNNYSGSIFNGGATSNFDLCTWATCGGHTLHETKKQSQVSSNGDSWGADYSIFVESGHPWVQRGGISHDGKFAGLFSSYYGTGDASYSYGFRPVLSAF
jgi:hypothetical protein